MATKESVAQIVEEIFKLNISEISKDRRDEIQGFAAATINGDVLQSYIVITATLGKDRKGALAYVLTNSRLIKIEIDAKEVQSSSFFLEKMIGIERKLIGGNQIEVSVSFNNDSFGLRYNPTDAKITEFFQKVDQSRSKGDS